MRNTTFNRTKIIATIGPASTDEEVLTEMIKEGVNVCRLNFSHGEHQEHLEVMRTIRRINEKHNFNTAILCDLQGPKIRVGKMPNGFVELVPNTAFNITTNPEKENDNTVSITYQNFPKDVQKGDTILLDDGKLTLQVTNSNGEDLVETEVIFGGKLKSNKGVNLPNTRISLPCLTEKDLKDLDFILEHDPDWIALSFVRESYDILALRQILESRQSFAKIIAKVEKPQALENIDSIIDATDAVMIARGDLGVEVPIEELPLAQKMIVKKCQQKARPVIIATQIMESMIESPQPTRAEVNDVANAVLDGADTLMVSGETSVGKFPVEVIKNINKIIRKIESSDIIYNYDHEPSTQSKTFLSDALCKNAVDTSSSVDATALVGLTVSGYTAFQLSSHRPRAFVFIFSGNRKLLTQMSLIWGVRGFYYDKYRSTDETFQDVNTFLLQQGFVSEGDLVINTASMPINERSRTNTLKITKID